MSAPLGYLSADGARAATILPLTWFTLGISLLVCAVIAACLAWALRRAGLRRWPIDMRAVGVERGGAGLRWIGIGLALSALPLFAILAWTMQALAATRLPERTALVLDVSAHQWWWEVAYHGDSPAGSFTTANEIHIPVGQPVRVRLHGGDVIHSFWVPKLNGKTDAIPGETTQTWMQADAPGRYRGQCTEYCGAQHAQMGLEVVAESPQDFAAWRARQLQPASAPQSAEAKRGAALVEYRCGLCHQVRGTTTGAVVAPDLTHVASRRRIASAALPNNAATLAAWIQDPQRVKPGTLMPPQGLDAQQLVDVVAYLETLQ